MTTAFEQTQSQSMTSSSAVDFDQTFMTGPTSRFVLENPRGRIVVRGVERSEIHVRATRRRGRSVEQFEATRVEAYQDGKTVFVRTVLDPGALLGESGVLSGAAAELARAFGNLFRWNDKTADVDYDVTVPAGCEVDLKGVASSIDLRDLRGPTAAFSVSGDLSAEGLAGLIRLQTISGAIRARAVDGSTYVESVSGHVQLAGRVASLVAKTVSGDLEIASDLQPTATYEVRTVSGTATFRVSPQTAASVTLRGVSGEVECEFPCDVTRNRRGPGFREWQGTLNGGGALLHVQTVSGHLRLRERIPTEDRPPAVVPEPVAATTTVESASETVGVAPPEETTSFIPESAGQTVDDALSGDAAASPESASNADEADGAAMSVLRKLEQGDIGVDEALRQLDQLRASV